MVSTLRCVYITWKWINDFNLFSQAQSSRATKNNSLLVVQVQAIKSPKMADDKVLSKTKPSPAAPINTDSNGGRSDLKSHSRSGSNTNIASKSGSGSKSKSSKPKRDGSISKSRSEFSRSFRSTLEDTKTKTLSTYTEKDVTTKSYLTMEESYEVFNIPIQHTRMSIFGDEYCLMREKFLFELRRMEEEIEYFR